ncbi:MAG TPA: phosphomannomutase/phosphoglucomutase [Eubacteriales bacterium]|nr:phosphomannomutase/phosphoglucomutase [Eubacteriales bacterium]
MEYRKLQNGSDIRGVAMEGVEGQPVNLTDEAVTNIAKAFVLFLQEKFNKSDLRLSIGRDSRLSGERLLAAAAEGVLSMGADLADFGMASTPSMFMSTVTSGYEYDGAIMLTASHLPWNRNGIKFFTRDGGLEKVEIASILARAQENAFIPTAERGKRTAVDFLSVYASGLVERIRKSVNAPDYDHPLKGFHIIVDAGNGAGGFFVDKVLVPLGADTSGSQFLNPDGMFPNHAPNPENEEAMKAVTACVLENHADMGVIFDTDVDRAGAVAADGREINRNRLIALISAVLLEEHPGTTIVTDSITSSGLAAFIAAKGGVHHRFKRGYKNVIDEAIRINAEGRDCQLAIETSGHGALKENYFLDDGAFLITKLLIKMAQLKKEGRTLFSLIDSLAEPTESTEVRMNLSCADCQAYGNGLLRDLGEYAKEQGWDVAKENHEGLRVSFGADDGDGWFLLRMSLHDPLMPLNIESNSVGGVHIIAQKLYAFLMAFDKLDTSKLKTI